MSFTYMYCVRVINSRSFFGVSLLFLSLSLSLSLLPSLCLCFCSFLSHTHASLISLLPPLSVSLSFSCLFTFLPLSIFFFLPLSLPLPPLLFSSSPSLLGAKHRHQCVQRGICSMPVCFVSPSECTCSPGPSALVSITVCPSPMVHSPIYLSLSSYISVLTSTHTHTHTHTHSHTNADTHIHTRTTPHTHTLKTFV